VNNRPVWDQYTGCDNNKSKLYSYLYTANRDVLCIIYTGVLQVKLQQDTICAGQGPLELFSLGSTGAVHWFETNRLYSIGENYIYGTGTTSLLNHKIL